MHSSPLRLPPLNLVLPHPQLPLRRSSHLSQSSSSPRTPRTCGSPCSSVFFTAPNRNSTDSWNSSNADDMEYDWKPEQTLLLSRTLDALPAHLVTPFNGPIPPSNLLDKIARGVAQAKGPVDWPHSIRATRVKLIELSRSRAREDTTSNHSIAEEAEDPENDDDNIDNSSNYSYYADGDVIQPHPTTHNNNTTTAVGIGKKDQHHRNAALLGSRRPLYRQSSMDFMNVAGPETKDPSTVAQLSSRLQRVDRLLSSSSYHPYSRTPRSHLTRRSSSPTRGSTATANTPSLINPSTPSSSTLNTLSTLSSLQSRSRPLRRSSSLLSSNTSNSMHSDGSPSTPPKANIPHPSYPLTDPRVQRVRQTAPCVNAPVPPPKESPAAAGVKRAPSFGALAQETRGNMLRTGGGGYTLMVVDGAEGASSNSSYPSSDEEERIRTKHAKKIRMKNGSVAVPASEPPVKSGKNSSGKSGAATSPSVCKEDSPKVKKSRTAVATASVPAVVNDENAKGADTKKRRKEVPMPATATTSPSRTRPRAMNLQRNPSMFGAELPHLRVGGSDSPSTSTSTSGSSSAVSSLGLLPSPIAASYHHYSNSHRAHRQQQHSSPSSPQVPAPVPAQSHQQQLLQPSPIPRTPRHVRSPSQQSPDVLSPGNVCSSPSSMVQPPMTCSPAASPGEGLPKVKTLRRVRRLAPARRISFGSLRVPGEPGATGSPSGADEGSLGSAFQLM